MRQSLRYNILLVASVQFSEGPGRVRIVQSEQTVVVWGYQWGIKEGGGEQLIEDNNFHRSIVSS